MAQGSAGGPLLFSRVTYQNFDGFWPQQTDGNPFTPVLNAATKYVVSSTLTEPLTWANSVLVRDGGELAAVKEREPGDIGVLGSGELVQTLLRDDLVDQFVCRSTRWCSARAPGCSATALRRRRSGW